MYNITVQENYLKYQLTAICEGCGKTITKYTKYGKCKSCVNKNRKGKSNKGGWNHSAEYKERMSKMLKGRVLSQETRKKISLAQKKRFEQPEERLKVSIAQKARLSNPENHPNWKGGITPYLKKLRASQQYKEWRLAVFERDNYTCVWCGDNTGGNLNADHIKPFAYFEDLRFELSNGRTLCVACHQKTPTFGNRKQ